METNLRPRPGWLATLALDANRILGPQDVDVRPSARSAPLVARAALPLGLTLGLATARADVIVPFEGECPPGLGRGIRNHAEVCVPNPCARDADCGEGAACRGVSHCVSERTVEPPRAGLPRESVQVVHGPCAEDGSCAEGRCRTVMRCEPIAPTPAWDPAARRWTGVPHPAPPTPRPSSSWCACGIGAPRRGFSRAPALALLVALAVRGRGRRRRAQTATWVRQRPGSR
jgi:hypothetical protein